MVLVPSRRSVFAFPALDPQYIAQQCMYMRKDARELWYFWVGYSDVNQHLSSHDGRYSMWCGRTITWSFWYLISSFTHDYDLPTTDLEGGVAHRLRLQSKVLPALRRFPLSRRWCESRESKSDDGCGCWAGAVLGWCRVVPGTRRCSVWGSWD